MPNSLNPICLSDAAGEPADQVKRLFLALGRLFKRKEFCESLQHQLVLECRPEEFFASTLQKARKVLPPEDRLESWVDAQIDHFLHTRGEIREKWEDPEFFSRLTHGITRNLPAWKKDEVGFCQDYMRETLLRRSLSFNPDKGSVEQWVFGSMRNLVKEWLRSVRNNPPTVHVGNGFADGPVEEIERREIFKRFSDKISPHMTTDDEKLYQYRYRDNLPYSQIARILDEQPDTLGLIETAVNSKESQKNELMAALAEIGLRPIAGEAVRAFAERALSAAKTWERGGSLTAAQLRAQAILRSLEGRQVESRVRKRLERFHSKLRRLIGDDPELAEVVCGIRHYDATRGELGTYKPLCKKDQFFDETHVTKPKDDAENDYQADVEKDLWEEVKEYAFADGGGEADDSVEDDEMDPTDGD